MQLVMTHKLPVQVMTHKLPVPVTVIKMKSQSQRADTLWPVPHMNSSAILHLTEDSLMNGEEVSGCYFYMWLFT
jgi:hypothetical protein